ncbi:MAG: S8 family peptidase [Parasphingorhabdus sp.]
MQKPSSYQASLLAVTALLLGSASSAVGQTVVPLPEAPIGEEAQVSPLNLDEVEDQVQTSVEEEARPVVTMGGTLNPFAGNIDPFGGSIDPFGGTIDPFGGTIDPFGGTINPFHGEIRALWGTIDPFGGSIDPFGGTIDPFGGTINPFYGNIDPFVGNIDPFSGVELPNYVEINAFWHEFGAIWKDVNVLLNQTDLIGLSWTKKRTLDTLTGQLVTKTNSAWGEAIIARNGGSTNSSFLDPLLAKYGLSATNLSGLRTLTKAQRAQLVSEWFDGLMGYTGFDHVDHWMKTVNWNPLLTEIQGAGADSVIGILDGSIISDPDFFSNVFQAGGYTSLVGGHGVGVASLILAKHDGQGVMGIAPNASVATYNPFDHTGTASWTDIRNGIVSLKQANASVINMSLGITGWTLHPEWNSVFNHDQVRAVANSTVFVIAAGNDGSSQSENVEWLANIDMGLIIVGAVDAQGNISSMSNRPGTACLAVGGICNEGSYLRDNFIVAPGELILMSDGAGGVVRRSGTSFAAPLVSGAITLLHDRWPWLANEPAATVSIILSTARDLGEPGTDNVYGRGLLDVEASQSPISFDALRIFEHRGGETIKRGAAELKASGIGETWNAEGVFLTLFETVGNTHRDFAVPFSDSLIGQKTSVNGSSEYFQSYITKRFRTWTQSGTDQTATPSSGGFTDVASYATPNRGGWTFAISSSNPANYLSNGRQGQIPHNAIRLSDEAEKFGFKAGYGQGSIALLGQESFGLTSDYNSIRGGLNPVLGLASGGGFMDAEIAISKNTKIAFGLTNRRLNHSENTELTEAERFQLRSADDYKANAFNLRMTHKPVDAVTLSVSLASLTEEQGLLGVQSALESDLRHGSNSKTITLGGSVDLPDGFNIAASATAGLTNSNGGEDQSLRTRGGVKSSAFAFSVGKLGVMNEKDQFRVTVTQPLYIESGTLEYSSVEVINRQTGEIGTVNRSFGIADEGRKFNAELLYATPIMNGGELSFFGRAEYDSTANIKINQIIAGGMLSLAF